MFVLALVFDPSDAEVCDEGLYSVRTTYVYSRTGWESAVEDYNAYVNDKGERSAVESIILFYEDETRQSTLMRWTKRASGCFVSPKIPIFLAKMGD